MRGSYYVPPAVLNVPARIHHATYKRVNGVNTPEYEADAQVIWVSAKSYGGTEISGGQSSTEKIVDGGYAIIDTMTFTTYYNPDIKAQDRIELLGNGDIYEIINSPENIDMRGAFMRFKAKRYHG